MLTSLKNKVISGLVTTIDKTKEQLDKIDRRLKNDVPGQMQELDRIIDSFEIRTKRDKEYVKRVREQYEKEVRSIFISKYDHDAAHEENLENLKKYREDISEKFGKALKSQDTEAINKVLGALGNMLRKGADKLSPEQS